MLRYLIFKSTGIGRQLLTISLTCILAWMLSQTGLADEVPSWLRQAAAAKCGPVDRNIPVLVMLDEARVKVESDGHLKTIRSYAMRINNREGKNFAVASESYLTDAGKIPVLKAWLVRPDGTVIKYEKKDIVELHASPDDLYNELLIRSISAASEAEIGDVFGYEIVSEEQPLCWHFEWMFQDRFPTLTSRYSITVPEKWKLSSITFNHSALAPVITGNVYNWELNELPAIKPEPNSPPITAVAPRIGITVLPPAEAKGKSIPSFANWLEVSRWLSNLSDSQSTPNEAITVKTRELTVSAKTEWEKLQAIARYVQGIRYVSIQTGLGRGGGYRPHSAIEVFAKGYGDCKDKANLMRAMLKAAGIESHLVTIYSGDPTFVRLEWPTPQQFNHCILAIKINQELSASSIIQHAKLGRLLIFDPTDPYTPIGDLPNHEQDSLALIIANESGSLERMPLARADANRLERVIEASISAEGAMSAKILELAHKQEAIKRNSICQNLTASEYRQLIEGVINRNLSGARLAKIEANSQPAEGKFKIEMDIFARQYAQNSTGQLLIFKPVFWGRTIPDFAVETSRQQPFLIEEKSISEILEIKLPEGFIVDEMIPDKTVESFFGKYQIRCLEKEGKLILTREFALHKGLVPAERYQEIVSFYAQIQNLEQTPIVLLKK